MANAIDLSFDSKHPRILPKNEENVEALIRREHEFLGHAGVGQVDSCLRRRFFLVSGREFVRKVIGRCVQCQRLFKPALTQRMADLPEARVNPAPPFALSGVDMFGPFYTKFGRGTQKRWVC